MRSWRAVLAILAALLAPGCNGEEKKAPAPAPAPPPPAVGVNPAKVTALLAHMNRGLAHLERYDYGAAAEELRRAVAVAPGFYPAQFDLGVALVNIQKDPGGAEKALRAAAVLAPREAAPHYMLGMLLTQGVSPPRTKEAEEEFRRAGELAPEDADCHHRLGLSMKEQGRASDAEKEFSRALELNPFLGAALYQRGLNRLSLDREEEGMADLMRFRDLERAGSVDGRDIAYGLMGPLGNAVRDLGPWLPPAAPEPPHAVAFVPMEGVLEDAKDPGGTIAVADLDDDGVLDLVLGGRTPGWREGQGAWKFGPFGALPALGSKSFGNDGGVDLAVADFDSDGHLDVAVEKGGVVMHAASPVPQVLGHPQALVPGRLLAADLDCDGDIDLVAGRTLLLNDGKGNLTPSPGPVALPVPPWEPTILADVDDDGFPDLVGRGSWVRNLRGGSFGGEKALPAEQEELVRRFLDRDVLAVGDADADGHDDRVEASGDGAIVRRGGPVSAEGGMRPHQVPGWPLAAPPTGGKPRTAVFADLDGDRDLDLVVAWGGALRFFVNQGDAGPNALQVRLAGVLHPNGKQFGWTNPRGIGARVEAFAGRRRVSRWMGLGPGLEGKPPPDVAFLGLGSAAKADLVSIRWTEGVIQAEPDVAVAPPGGPPWVRIEEVQRKAASCPVVFSWDGERFAFVADCMGGGGLGFFVAPGQCGPPDPTERVRIAGRLLRPRDGFYEVRLLEPLEEVTYADRLALVAVDHPAGTEVYPDERFGGVAPPPGERVFVHALGDQVLPLKATDARGGDVSDRLARTDRVYAEGFELHRDLLGFTEKDHGIDLNFGGRVPEVKAGERLMLFLSGWIEYGYSRTFYAAAGAGVAPLSPTLEVPDGQGGWKTGIADIGYPAGTPRTMTHDVTGVVTPASPRFRIRSNLEIYWDRAWLAVDRGEAGILRSSAAPAEAALRFAGFPREVSPDGRLPKVNDYALMDPAVPGFKVMAGEYTRYGDVRPLLLAADDRTVVFRNGEEIALRFRVADFPPLREGWTRDFLLETEGWCKDMDPYTATPATVGPLPFRAMTAYPPPPGGAYPSDDDHRAWRREWNTRTVSDTLR